MSGEELRAWFASRVPATWFSGPLEIVADRDEIVVLGPLSTTGERVANPLGSRGAEASAVKAFREATRDDRMRIASEAEERFGRAVSWGVRCGDQVVPFTTASVPVMTRLRLTERQVLDTLIDAGVARSRSEALAWCVRLVGAHEDDWLAQLRVTLAEVKAVRDRGPRA